MPDANSLEYFKNALTLVKLENELKEKQSSLKRMVVVKEEKYKSLEKTKEDIVNEKVNEAEKSLKKSYDEMVYQADIKVKDLENEKKKLKVVLEKNRIEKNTKTYIEDNDKIKTIIKQKLKEYKLPYYVNTDLYYTIFLPNSIKEYISCIVIIALLLGILPIIIYFILGNILQFKRPILLIVIYMVDIFLFGLLYIYISNKTTEKYKDEIKELQGFRKDLKENKKQVKNITANIKHDTDDTNYDLEEIDSKIRRAKKDLEDVQDKKLKAIKQFEEIVRQNIAKEVEKASKEDIQGAKKELEAVQNDFENATKELEETQNKIHIQCSSLKAEELNEQFLEKKIKQFKSSFEENNSLVDAKENTTSSTNTNVDINDNAKTEIKGNTDVGIDGEDNGENANEDYYNKLEDDEN